MNGEHANNHVGRAALLVGGDHLRRAFLSVLCLAAPERAAAVRHMLALFLVGFDSDAELCGAA